MEERKGMEQEKHVTRAEIAFDIFPCGPCASEAHRTLTSLKGVVQIIFDPCVCRATVFFDPAKVDIPLILSTLEPFGPKPRVISVTLPMRKEWSNGKNRYLR